MISPSPGMIWPASHARRPRRAARWPARSRAAAWQHAGPWSPPGLAQRGRLGLAAALGHRLGEVGEQHREPEPERDLSGEQRIPAATASSRTQITLVIRLPISTMNITGFRIWMRGSSLQNESTTAGRRMVGSQIEIRRARSAMTDSSSFVRPAAAAPHDSSSARFSSSTLTRARPRIPSVGGSVCDRIRSRRVRRTRRARAPPGPPGAAPPPAGCADPGRRRWPYQLGRDRPGATPSSCAAASRRSCTAFRWSGFDGPSWCRRWMPRCSRRPRAAAEVLGPAESLRDQPRADQRAVLAPDQAAFACAGTARPTPQSNSG